MIKPHKKRATWGGKGLYQLTTLRSHSSLTEVRAEAEAGTEAEAMEGHCLLASSHERATGPEVALPPVGQPLLHQSSIRKMPYRFASDQ